MSSLKYWLWLNTLTGLTNLSRLRLLAQFGTPEGVYYADSGELSRVEGLSRGQARLLEDKSLKEADRVLGECERLGLRVLTLQDAAYPGRLKNIFDPPALLYLKGRLPAVDEEVTVAMVGTRAATPYGVRSAEELGYGLAKQGAVVVSGMAQGIDAAALRGALRAGGRTISVLGCGIDVVYPAENRYLYEDVAAAGAILSEYAPGTEPRGEHFPVRNRIISGLALGTVVVEAPEKRSGALNTAHTALEQGRDVFAVPGGIDAEMSRGCNGLIKEGAALVTEAWDILREYQAAYPDKVTAREFETPRELGHQARQKRAEAREEKREEAEKAERALRAVSLSSPELSLSDDQIAVLRALPGGEALQADDVVEATGLTARRVLSALTVLVMEGLAEEESGKRFRRAVELKD
ncbi:MAG: DNA-processing protein DprA [Oscillospiraceae bacterium]